MDIRTPPPAEPSDEDIIRAIQMRAHSDREWAIAWSILRLAAAVDRLAKAK